MHDCYLCGGACYCHGDIDDCQVETIEYAYDHCEGCGCEEDGDFDDYDDFDLSDDCFPPPTDSAAEMEWWHENKHLLSDWRDV